jgi:hydroxymethylpyrimidine/phosphomethylpyrimidine kinase
MYTYFSVMTVAGFDPSGGAGIQADIKTISALGCYATSALTALPVQNTCGVRSIHPIPVGVVAEQMRAIIDDIPPDAIKIGMVHSAELVDTIVDTLAGYPSGPWHKNMVFDPVMVATSGHRLIEDETVGAIVERLFPLAAIITPNMDEAAVLAGMAIETLDDMYAAGEKILKLGCRSLLLKGGHLKTPRLTSLFFDGRGGTGGTGSVVGDSEGGGSIGAGGSGGSVVVTEYHSERVDTRNTHGSGCTLSSAIASYLARGESLPEAVRLAQEYVSAAIVAGSDVRIGHGNGPLNHFHDPHKQLKVES